MLLIALIMKYPKLQRVKLFFEKLFWLDELQGEGFLRKSLQFFGKLSMLMYLFAILWSIVRSLIFFDFSMLYGIFFIGIGFPLCYRLVVGFQRYLHNV